MTLTRTEVRALLDRHRISPKRSLGQNFVVEPNTVRRIAELAAVGPGDRVLEIGPGVGSLTLALVETGAEVTAVEIDDVLAGVVAEVTAGRAVRVVHADAMTVDWSDVLGDGPWHLVANLPYNVSVPLEVADRLVAAPGDGAYGLPSVKVAYHAEARMVGRVPPSVFLPRPRVDSALVRIERRSSPAVEGDPEILFALVRAGFGQRRKMVRRSLAGLIDVETIGAAGVDPTARAEALTLDDWATLAREVAGR